MTKNETLNQRAGSYSISGITSVILFGIIGFIASNTTITGGLSPLNVSAAACTNLFGSIAVFATSIISYLVNGTISFALPQICSMIAIICLKFFMSEIWDKKTTPIFSSISAGLVMAIFGVFATFIGTFSIQNFVLHMSQAVLCACTVYFIFIAHQVIKNEKIIPVTGKAAASLGVIYVVALATLTSIDISRLNFGRIIGILITLLAIKKYKHLGGAVVGVLTSCGIILCSPVLGRSTMLLACAGLIAGLFSEFGGLAIISSFIISNLVGLVAIGVTTDTFPMLIDVGIATVIFIVIPPSVWSRLLQSVGTSASGVEVMAQNASERLIFASKTLNDVKDSITKVSVAMEKKTEEQDIVSKVCENVCSKCKNNLICWEKNFDETIASFYKIQRSLNVLGKVSVKDFPQELNHCINNSLLENEFNILYSEINYQFKLKQKLKEMRVMLSDQFSAMEEMLTSLSMQLSGYAQSDNFLSKKVYAYFQKKGIVNAKSCVYYNIHGSLTVEIYAERFERYNDEDLCEEISTIVERELELPRYSTVGDMTRIELWEKPMYSVDIGAYQIAGKRSEITGDSYETFIDNDTEAYIVLSDGMGSGKRAQLDSLLTSSLISRLIRAGIGYSSAIRLVNTSMRVKAWEESFATVDISILNLCSGTLKIVKAGASASYLVRGEQLKKLETTSLPIGIIQEVTPATINVNLKPDDIIITASDGVIEDSLESLRQIAVTNRKMPAEDMAIKMVKAVKKLADERYCDDITIVISKLKKN